MSDILNDILNFVDKFLSGKPTMRLMSLNIYSILALAGIYLSRAKLEENQYAKKKVRLLVEVCKWFKENSKNILQLTRQHLNELERALLCCGYSVKLCKIKSISKSVIGASESFGKIPFEVGIFFDPIYNVPFIPGSTIKGALRSALIELLYKDLKEKSISGKNEKQIIEEVTNIANIIFGSQKWSGLVGVTDAYPTEVGENGLLLEPDVITPHYSNARTEEDVVPIPVQFLTIARGVKFMFYIYFNKKVYEWEYMYLLKEKKIPKRQLVKIHLIKNLAKSDEDIIYGTHNGDLRNLIQKLQEKLDINLIPYIDRAVLYAFIKGVGAKTSLGYSRFEIIEYKVIR